MILFALALAASHHFHGLEHDRAQHPMPMPGVTAPSKPVGLTISPFAPQPVTPAPSFPPGYNPFAPQPAPPPAPSVPPGFNPFAAALTAPSAPLTAKQLGEIAFMLTPQPNTSSIAVIGPGGAISYEPAKTPLAPPPGAGAQFEPVTNPSPTQAGAQIAAPTSSAAPGSHRTLFDLLFGN